MPKNNTEAVVRAVEATLNGETDAYTVIVKQYMQKIYRTALSFCGNTADAEDLAQETFITGYLQLSSLREYDKVESWLMRILKNKAFNHLARSGRLIPTDEIPETVSFADSPEERYVKSESMLELRAKLEKLSPALKDAALLYFWYDMPIKLIAERLSLPVGTVKRRIHDAREKLKKENTMSDNINKLSENFAEAIEAKIKELEEYNRTHSKKTVFDSSYSQLKNMIKKLTNENTAGEYFVKSAGIAAQTDLDKYFEEALETYRKYNEPFLAAGLYLAKCWKLNGSAKKLEYTKNTVIPALEDYPESEEKHLSLGKHKFWMAFYTDRKTPEGIADAKKLLSEAFAELEQTNKPNAYYANTIAALKGIEEMSAGRELCYVCVTGETYRITEGNLKFEQQPGCNYRSDGNLAKLQNYIFYNAGCTGDRYFFPRTIPIEAGRQEVMTDKYGNTVGIRKVVAVSDTVYTPAGLFEGCVHIEKSEGGEKFDIWYKDGVGLIKLVNSGSMLTAKVLCSYDIKGGEGLFPLAVGNRWNYVGLDKPDFLYERNEYSIERMDSENVCMSALNFISCEKDWEKNTEDPFWLFFIVSDMCTKKQYGKASEILQKIVMLNKSRESVDIALASLEYFREKQIYDKQNWRFCPSSVNISEIGISDGKYSYREGYIDYFDTGVWGSRSKENRIFGVKPFRFLNNLCSTLWDEKWVPGYTELSACRYKEGDVKLSVSDGGKIASPAGVFEDTVRLTVEFETEGDPEDYKYYFYENTDCGKKEFWFAKGVGIVRFRCVWGNHLDSDCYLTKYNVIADENDMMPVYIGNSWTYEEKYLTEENYIARRDYKVISGNGGRYLLSDNQMFTWKGSKEEYEAWKKGAFIPERH